MSGIIRILFHNWSRNLLLEADCGADITGSQILEGLTKAGFLDPGDGHCSHTLQLKRTQSPLAEHETLRQAGVQDGDTVVVLARPCCC